MRLRAACGLKSYRDRVGVVTGASSGIGAALARELARRGMSVALVARRADRLRQLAETIEASGGRASVHPSDASKPESVAEAAEGAIARWGRIDLLVNGAASCRHVLFEHHPIEDIEAMVRTNLLGTIYWIREVLPAMQAQGGGAIVNFSSFAGCIGQPDEAVYSATKAAVAGLSQALTWEVERAGIHVMVVYPVLVRTEMLSPDVVARLPEGMAKRCIGPDELALSTLRALERGEREVTIPRRYRGAVLLRALSPRVIGRKMARVKLERVPGMGRG